MIVVDSKDNLQDPNMRAEAISGTNLFGYKERQNSTENAANLLPSNQVLASH
jgi:hypothetical protein